jgi:hypothetical protein
MFKKVQAVCGTEEDASTKRSSDNNYTAGYGPRNTTALIITSWLLAEKVNNRPLYVRAFITVIIHGTKGQSDAFEVLIEVLGIF